MLRISRHDKVNTQFYETLKLKNIKNSKSSLTFLTQKQSILIAALRDSKLRKQISFNHYI